MISPPSNPGTATLEELINARFNRRSFVQGAAASMVTAPFASIFGCTQKKPSTNSLPQPLSPKPFQEVSQGIDGQFHVAKGYHPQVLLRWGDPILADAPPFDIQKQSPKSQLGQFGSQNDFIAFMPLPFGSQTSDHGLLCVNHEFVSAHMMFPGFTQGWGHARDNVNQSQSETLMAASGHSVVEIKKENSGWKIIQGKYNRRISLLETHIDFEGPARGHPKLRTSANPDGFTVLGTLANCSGGVTPWGTILFCEENIEHYFADTSETPIKNPHHERYGLYSAGQFPYFRFQKRFRLNEEPNEANRFGWVVEYDPYSPNSRPIKRTAMGRVQREGATAVLDPSGHVVVYSGDDHYFEYLYRFVSKEKYNPNSRESNLNLLNEGTLSVAQFQGNGTLKWHPLIFGEGPLTSKNGFENQADLLIQTRQAADLLKATPMDRPEGIAVNPKTGRVYVMLTKNKKRAIDQANGANPIAKNLHGHILEIIPSSDSGTMSHTSVAAKWDILLFGGDRNNPAHHAQYHKNTTAEGQLANPDNCAFDSSGRLWISTDGAEKSFGSCDGLWVCETNGEQRAQTRRFIRVPQGGELCSPAFTPDNTTLFVSVQHPGDGRTFHFANPKNRWPDFQEGIPPRPSVVAITHPSGKKIGS